MTSYCIIECSPELDSTPRYGKGREVAMLWGPEVEAGVGVREGFQEEQDLARQTG